jgi:DNA-binding XRE family transcriptional regulator
LPDLTECSSLGRILQFVCNGSFAVPNEPSLATYHRAPQTGWRRAISDAPRRDRLVDLGLDDGSGARVGRRLYWAGSARQPRREGTVVAVYRESRDESVEGVVVIDVRWDPPLPSERPRGPLSLGIPVERVGTSGWGWVDRPDLPPSTTARPNAVLDSGGQLALPLPERFGNAVRRIRTLQGLSQERLATACGLHRTFIGAVERGETNISLATLARLAKGLDVSVSHLVGEAESVPDER